MADNEVKSETVANFPTYVLEDENCKENLGGKLEVEADAENRDASFVSKTMEEEEEKLEEERVKEEEEKANEPREGPHLNDVQFTKLDELLKQTQLYSEFLLETMDDITKSGFEDDGKTIKGGKKGRGSKRKSTASYNDRKAKRAVAAMLTRTKEGVSVKDSTLTDEEKNEKEQAELVPLLTGGKLKSYQIKGVKWMISLWQNGLNGILADQMGLGKTIQTIAFLAHLKGNGLHGPYLIIAPLSTLSNWMNEIQRFAPSMNAIIYHGDKKQRDEILSKHMPRTIGPKFPIVITPYEIALCDARHHLRHYSWKFLVVDEGHRLKNSKCKLMKELRELSVENRLLLSGTPLQNNLAELWSLLNFVLPDNFSSHEEFESWFDFSGMYTSESFREEMEEKRRAQVVAKLHAILRPFLLRRMKVDVEQKLPRKKEIIPYEKNFQDHLINRTLESHLIEKSNYGMHTPSHQGSSSTPIMDAHYEDVDEAQHGMTEEELEIHDRLIEGGQSQGTQPENHDEGARLFEKIQRKRSSVWDDMLIVEQPDGSHKVQCKYCKEMFAKSSSGATSQHKRHLDHCLQRKLSLGEETRKKQQVLSFTEGTGEGDTSITNYTYDHAKVRELAAHMVLVHEYPFSMMEHVVFNKFMKAASPFYKKINRQMVKEDCVTTYTLEKKRLRNILKGCSRVSITTDLWKSGQKIQYMVVTGHFVDSDWMLQKRVLNFCNIPPPHTGVIIADALSKCFLDWGIENKISTIIVDNASYNDVCIRRLKEDFSLRKKLSIGGKIFHVRCCAHILNLLVQDALCQIVDVIDVVRDGVKYLKNSESRLNEFSKIKKQLQLSSKKLILDCPTRWNSTYLMLASALEFRDVFPRYKDIDPGFHYVPSELDWMKVDEVCRFLEIFYEITNIISGSDYPTSNQFLVELYRIKELLNEKVQDDSDNIRSMAASMVEKFDKYWGESNILLSLASILDPRYKMFLIHHAFPIIYGENAAANYIEEIRGILHELYSEYVDAHMSSHTGEFENQSKQKQAGTSSVCTQRFTPKIGRNVLTGKAKFQMLVKEIYKTPPQKSDLDIYLEEGMYDCDINANLDVLTWWKGERWRFPILSRMASDILAIPVTTVASESTFSAGGRIIDDRHASMSVDTVQTLLCGNDWIRNLHGLKNKFTDSLDASNSCAIEEIEVPDI